MLLSSRFVNMNELTFLTLTAVADHPRHGYAILQEIKAITDGDVVPQVATLYRTIDRVESDGQIVEDRTEVVDGRFRRVYRLTDRGAADLAAAALRRAATATVASQRLEQPATAPGLTGGAA